jgi:hypothetical protein
MTIDKLRRVAVGYLFFLCGLIFARYAAVVYIVYTSMTSEYVDISFYYFYGSLLLTISIVRWISVDIMLSELEYMLRRIGHKQEIFNAMKSEQVKILLYKILKNKL